MFELLPAICYAKGFLYAFLGIVGILLVGFLLAGAILGTYLGLCWVGTKLFPNKQEPWIKNTDKFINKLILAVVLLAYVMMSLLLAKGICQ